jgi:hypothetical protein
MIAIIPRGRVAAQFNEEQPEASAETMFPMLAGILAGEEIYYTGLVRTPIRKSRYNFFSGGKFSGTSVNRRFDGVWTMPSNQTGDGVS